jgi:hypothetical protein
MRKTILTILGSALLAASTEEFRNSNAYACPRCR